MSAIAALRVAPSRMPLASGLRLYGFTLLAGMAVTWALGAFALVNPERWELTDKLLLALYPVLDLLMLAALLRVGAGLERGRGLAGAAAVLCGVALLADLASLATSTADGGYLAATVLQTISVIVLLSVLRMTARRAGRRALAACCVALQLAMVPAIAAVLATLEAASTDVWMLASVASFIPWIGVAVLCLRAADLPPRRTA